jgi:hypothetical protein
MDGGPGSQLKSEFEMERPGEYSLTLNFTRAVDYGDFRMTINDQPVTATFKGYHDGSGKSVVTQSIKLGKFNLKEGVNTLQLEIVGKQPKAIGRYMVGIDYLKIRTDE